MKLRQVLKESRMNPNETLRQLGGNKFKAMTGANRFVFDEKQNELSFKLPKAKNSINHVSISLNSLDLYDVKFRRLRGGMNPSFKVVKEFKNVYAENLVSIFEETTGLYTKLF